MTSEQNLVTSPYLQNTSHIRGKVSGPGRGRGEGVFPRRRSSAVAPQRAADSSWNPAYSPPLF